MISNKNKLFQNFVLLLLLSSVLALIGYFWNDNSSQLIITAQDISCSDGTFYWDNSTECVIDSDRTCKNATIIYTCDIIVNNSAIWNVSDVTLKSNQSSDYQYQIYGRDGAVLYFDDVTFTYESGTASIRQYYFGDDSSVQVYLYNCDFASYGYIEDLAGNTTIINTSYSGYIYLTTCSSCWAKIQNSNLGALSLYSGCAGDVNFTLPYSQIDWAYLYGSNPNIYGYYDTTGDGTWSGSTTRHFPICVYNDSGITNVGAGCNISLIYNGNVEIVL